MRISDWSSDVCSSDLDGRACAGLLQVHQPHLDGGTPRVCVQRLAGEARRHMAAPQSGAGGLAAPAAGGVGGLARLAQDLGDEGVAALPRRAGTEVETVVAIRTAASAHWQAPSKAIASADIRHAISPESA